MGSFQGRSALRRMRGADMPEQRKREMSQSQVVAPEINSSAGAGVWIATATERKQRKKK